MQTRLGLRLKAKVATDPFVSGEPTNADWPQETLAKLERHVNRTTLSSSGLQTDAPPTLDEEPERSRPPPERFTPSPLQLFFPDVYDLRSNSRSTRRTEMVVGRSPRIK